MNMTTTANALTATTAESAPPNRLPSYTPGVEAMLADMAMGELSTRSGFSRWHDLRGHWLRSQWKVQAARQRDDEAAHRQALAGLEAVGDLYVQKCDSSNVVRHLAALLQQGHDRVLAASPAAALLSTLASRWAAGMGDGELPTLLRRAGADLGEVARLAGGPKKLPEHIAMAWARELVHGEADNAENTDPQRSEQDDDRNPD